LKQITHLIFKGKKTMTRTTLYLLLFLILSCTTTKKPSSRNVTSDKKKLYSLLGRLPDRNRPIKAQLISREEKDDIIIERLMLDLNGIEQVPAYFTKPKNSTGRSPVVLFNHSHFGQYNVGKDEFLFGRKEMQAPPYAVALARQGYAGL
jgi:hypothetical protein